MKNLFRIVLLTSIVVLGLWKQNSSAEDAEDKKRTSIDFEDELIQGDVKKPELFYLLQKKQFNFKRLIKLRNDFIPEMRRTAEEVERGGSDH